MYGSFGTVPFFFLPLALQPMVGFGLCGKIGQRFHPVRVPTCVLTYVYVHTAYLTVHSYKMYNTKTRRQFAHQTNRHFSTSEVHTSV